MSGHDDHCPTCGHSIRKWRHTLTKGLVATLVKFAKACEVKGDRTLHLQDDVDLTYSQACNFQKLRYWGLVDPYEKDDGTRRTGRWTLTQLGLNFLSGQQALFRSVWTYRGKPVEWDETRVLISDVSDKVAPYFEQADDFASEPVPVDSHAPVFGDPTWIGRSKLQERR